LPNNFYRTLELVPKQRLVSIILNADQDLNNFVVIDFFDGYWIDMSILLLAMQYSIDINQHI